MNLKTINIKGKEYVMVHERIRAFHELYPKGCILTEVVNQNESNILMCCKVYPDSSDFTRCFTGYAFEKNSGGMVNTTSHVENCETSAVGRALGFLGIGVETSIATAEEVGNAIKQQEPEIRVYTYNGKKYPHVTNIISPDPLPIPSWHMDVGTEVDLYMKAFFQGKVYVPDTSKFSNISEAVNNLKECIEAAKDWLIVNGTDIQMKDLDVKIINHDDLYVGTDDMECVYNNMYSIVDFKKTKNLDKKIVEKYFMQMAAYAKGSRFDKKDRPEIKQLVIASPFNDPVVCAYPDIDKYYEKFLDARKEFKKRFKL